MRLHAPFIDSLAPNHLVTKSARISTIIRAAMSYCRPRFGDYGSTKQKSSIAASKGDHGPLTGTASLSPSHDGIVMPIFAENNPSLQRGPIDPHSIC